MKDTTFMKIWFVINLFIISFCIFGLFFNNYKTWHLNDMLSVTLILACFSGFFQFAVYITFWCY